jgi:O-succinylbenzoic acid--CoA ligase
MKTWWLHPRRDGCGPWRHPLTGIGGALAWLAAHGVRRGQRLALGGLDRPATAQLAQAALAAGVVLVPLNRRLDADAVRGQRAAVHADAAAAHAGHPLAGPEAWPLPETFPDAPVPALDPVDGDAPALVLFTSGTTGDAKAVRLHLGALLAGADAAVARLGLTTADAWLACLPLDHIGGLGSVLRSGRAGFPLLLCERFDTAAVAAQLDHEPITGASLVPTMLHRLCALRSKPWPARVRTLLVGGGPLDAALIARATALGVAPCQTYGLTECASQVCTLAPAEAAAHAGSAGRALDGVRVRVRDDGVIEVDGAVLFAGYEHAGGFTPRPPGWFATGDCGRLDADGFLTVRGRHDDLIITGGENVAPDEVEAALRTHPAIADAAVVGTDDAEWGRVVCAALVAHGAAPDDDAFAAWCARLPAHHRPRRWRWVAALPRTATGKLVRRDAAALFG